MFNVRNKRTIEKISRRRALKPSAVQWNTQPKKERLVPVDNNVIETVVSETPVAEPENHLILAQSNPIETLLTEQSLDEKEAAPETETSEEHSKPKKPRKPKAPKEENTEE